MNRRGFLGSLAAAVVAPFLPKPKAGPEPEFYGKELVPDWTVYSREIRHYKDNGAVSAGDLVSIDKDGNIIPCKVGMEELGRAVGRAHQEIKIQLATKMFDL